MFRKLSLSLVVFFLTLSQSFALTQIDLRSDISSPQLNKPFTITIEITSDTQESGQITSFGGLENFAIVSQRNSNSIKNINDEVEVKNILQYVVNPVKTGDYTLGPIVINDSNGQIYESNIINIQVGLPANRQKTIENDQIYPAEKLHIDWMELVYYPSLLFLLIFFIIYGIYFIRSNKKVRDQIQEILPTRGVDDELIERLEVLQQNQNQWGRTEFYAEFNSVLRSYLEYIGIENASKKTYKEIQLLGVDEKLLQIFHGSYINEFSQKEEIEGYRNGLITDLITIIRS